MTKTVVVEWEGFMSGNVPVRHPVLMASSAGLGVMSLAMLQEVDANVMTAKIVHAFDPLISVMQALAYPVSFLSISAGMLLISVGQRHRGINMIKWGAIGYIGMQIVPGIMEMVAQVGEAMK